MNSTAEADIASKHLRQTWEALSERERKVVHAVVERVHISRPVHREMDEGLTFGQRLADRVASFGGSWPFIGLFFLFILAWIGTNTLLVVRPYDPYPYILLNLLLSCLAAVQAPIILMSQNRQSDRDRRHAEHDYEVNLKAEIEIMQIHEKLELLRTRELARIVELQETQARMLEELFNERNRAR